MTKFEVQNMMSLNLSNYKDTKKKKKIINVGK